jgi:RND family efflux transporter MFP subunit
MPSARTTRVIVAATVAAVVIATAVAISRSGPPGDRETASPPRPALVVTTAFAESMALPNVITASGTVAAWQEASVSSRSSGLPVVAILADVGDHVQKGQLLARFDDSTLQAEVARAEAALAQSQARLEEARSNRDRALELGQSSLLSRQDVLKATTSATAAEAEVSQSRALLRTARLALAHARVLAPDAGVISSRSIALGAVAQPGTELFRLIRQGRLEWRVELTAQQLVLVKPGVTAAVRTLQGGTVKGTVRSVAPSLDVSTRTGIAYVDLEPSPAVRASMYLQGDLQLGEQTAVTVPSASVIIRDGRSYVAALEGNRVKLLAVTTGIRSGDRVEITRGVVAGAMVAVRGAGFLNDGDVVRVVTAG